MHCVGPKVSPSNYHTDPSAPNNQCCKVAKRTIVILTQKQNGQPAILHYNVLDGNIRCIDDFADNFYSARSSEPAALPISEEAKSPLHSRE